MDDTALAGWVASSLAYLTGTCTDMPWTDATSERTTAMTESYLRPARAFHDLNGVNRIEIIGWIGRYEVAPHAVGNFGVSILAPRRHPDEFWTFQATTPDGTLRCHSDLIGSPSLLTETAEPLKVLLPADRINRINVIVRETGL